MEEAEVVKEETLVATVTGLEANVMANAPPDILAPLDSEIVSTELSVTEVLPVMLLLSVILLLPVAVDSTIVGTEKLALVVILPAVV